MLSSKSLDVLFVNAAVRLHCIKVKTYEMEVTAEKVKSNYKNLMF